jgi:NAD(P)-dependent dehydrogenase (short-subunit alcohol dehydrogenase family)
MGGQRKLTMQPRNNKVTVVIGGINGIGQALARRYLCKGARVVATMGNVNRALLSLLSSRSPDAAAYRASKAPVVAPTKSLAEGRATLVVSMCLLRAIFKSRSTPRVLSDPARRKTMLCNIPTYEAFWQFG